MKNLIVVTLLLGALVFGASKWLLHRSVESGVDDVVTAMSPFARVDYDGVSSTMGGRLTIDSIEVQAVDMNDTISIDRLGVDTPSYFALMGLADIGTKLESGQKAIPEYIGFIVENIRVQVDADYFKKLHNGVQKVATAADAAEPAAVCTGKYGFSPETLQELGYAEQVVSASVYLRHDTSSYSLSVRSSVDNMWVVDIELTMAGNMMAELMKGPRARPKLRELRIEYTDDSLNERVFNYCRRLGMTNEEIIAAQLDKLGYFGSSMGIEFDEYVIDPYTQFLDGKSTLVVTAKPVEPVSLSQINLYKPSDVPALLDLSAETL